MRNAGRLCFYRILKQWVGVHDSCFGIILFRTLSLSPLSVNAFIIDFVRRTDLDKLAACVAVVDPVHVRVRFPLINSE